jgi:hypothetical protein
MPSDLVPLGDGQDARLRSTIETLADSLQVLVLSIEACMREATGCRNCKGLAPVTARTLEAARHVALELETIHRSGP